MPFPDNLLACVAKVLATAPPPSPGMAEAAAVLRQKAEGLGVFTCADAIRQARTSLRGNARALVALRVLEQVCCPKDDPPPPQQELEPPGPQPQGFEQGDD